MKKREGAGREERVRQRRGRGERIKGRRERGEKLKRSEKVRETKEETVTERDEGGRKERGEDRK